MMPITRAAAKSVRPSSKVDAQADESYDESEFSDEAFSDEDSDYDNGRKTAKPPPAKKAKKESAKQASAKSSRQKKCLSLLPAMPLDVLFEVKITCIVGHCFAWQIRVQAGKLSHYAYAMAIAHLAATHNLIAGVCNVYECE